MAECGDNLFQREVPIYYWTQAIRFDRSHHLISLLPIDWLSREWKKALG
jgi:hypothetical protein